MINDVRQFLLTSLTEMKYSTDGVDDSTPLGPAGVDLESLALAELAMRVEDRYAVRFDEDEAETFAAMTMGELCAAVEQRVRAASTA